MKTFYEYFIPQKIELEKELPTWINISVINNTNLINKYKN